MGGVIAAVVSAVVLAGYWLFLCRCERQQRAAEEWEAFLRDNMPAIVVASRRLSEGMRALGISFEEAARRIERSITVIREQA